MKHVVPICLIFFGYAISPLKAGGVVTIANGSEVSGKVTLTSSSIRVATSASPTEIKLTGVLEADFGEASFHLDFFSSNSTPDQLPADWKAQDIGHPTLPGSMTYAAGTFTMTSSGAPLQRKKNEDLYFFAGGQWTGDGQWTVRLRERDPDNQAATVGLMLRDSLDDNPITFGMGAYGMGANGTGGGSFYYRNTVGEHPGVEGDFSVDLPAWLRLTRKGPSIDATLSTDGKEWRYIGHYEAKVSANPWVGLFVNSFDETKTAKLMLDQVAFTPLPCEAQVVPIGVLLQSGSFLAGYFNPNFEPAKPDATGKFNRNGKLVDIPRSKVAVVTFDSAARSEITAAGLQIGLIMRNGDFQAGEPDLINGGGVHIYSELLGPVAYDRAVVRACFLHSLQAQPAAYEFRLKDGSIIYASDFKVDNTGIIIQEVSGLQVNASLDEIAQLRAGTARVQSLAELDWKATPPPTNAAPVANAAPIANALPNQLPSVWSWEGNNQEQILGVPAGTTVEFPLADKFRALGARVALSSDSPPNSTATIRVLADGKEVARTPPFKAGDQPRFMKIAIRDPKSVTLEADSTFAGTKVLFIDPVVIRGK